MLMYENLTKGKGEELDFSIQMLKAYKILGVVGNWICFFILQINTRHDEIKDMMPTCIKTFFSLTLIIVHTTFLSIASTWAPEMVDKLFFLGLRQKIELCFSFSFSFARSM